MRYSQLKASRLSEISWILARLNVTNISHKVCNIPLVIGDLFVDIVVTENLVGLRHVSPVLLASQDIRTFSQNTRNIVMDIDDLSLLVTRP